MFIISRSVTQARSPAIMLKSYHIFFTTDRAIFSAWFFIALFTVAARSWGRFDYYVVVLYYYFTFCVRNRQVIVRPICVLYLYSWVDAIPIIHNTWHHRLVCCKYSIGLGVLNCRNGPTMKVIRSLDFCLTLQRSLWVLLRIWLLLLFHMFLFYRNSIWF